MAYPKKKTPAGGGGPGKEPPDELAVPKAAADADNQGYGGYGDCDRVTIEGPVTVQGPDSDVPPPIRVEPVGPVKVSLQRSTAGISEDQGLWPAIRYRTFAIGFSRYREFIYEVFFGSKTLDPKAEKARERLRKKKDDLLDIGRLSHGVDAYQLLKTATEAFLMVNCGVYLPERAGTDLDLSEKIAQEESRVGVSWEEIRESLITYIGDDKLLPYLEQIVPSLSGASPVGTVLAAPFDPCLLELIWSYWHEEGMLVQAVNAISLRFQNKRIPGDRNPLAQLEIDPLRPLSNLLWGYIQDEPFRLTVARRSYEYDHHYGLKVVGRAVPVLYPADSRSKFLEAFHSLLYQVSVFYKQDADTTVIADAFPILNALREVHMLLAEGAHNQFRDLPWTARVEMLIQQWLLSRPEIQEFLRGRAMVPYKEPWMGSVDTLRRMLGWGDTSVTAFRDLGVYGEQILLSIRYGAWAGDAVTEDSAKNWARYWKPEIQGYVHAYRAATGIDLTTADMNKQINSTPPSVLIQRRIGQRGAR